MAPSLIALQPYHFKLTARNSASPHRLPIHMILGPIPAKYLSHNCVGVVDYCIIGHSERRQLFHASDKDIRASVAAALRNQITPILCIGETETEHTFGETHDVIRDQLLGGLSEVSSEDISKVIIAYEPIWAISTTTGAHLASPDEIAEITGFIRRTLADTYGDDVAQSIPVLYGGSVNPSNAGAYLTVPGVNGLLVGGASLIADQFVDIIETAKKVQD